MKLPDGLLSSPIAHRGLWRPGEAAENSLAAFDMACSHAYGIELDVQLSADGEAMVFHDEALKRLTGVDGQLSELTAQELAGLALHGGPDRIPTLAETLRLIAGRVMLLVEIKAGPQPTGVLEERVAHLLDHYHGPAAVISFDAAALAWFGDHRPGRARGLDALGLGEGEDAKGPNAHFEAACALATPHFLVLEKTRVLSAPAQAARAGGTPVIAWTMRSSEEVGAVAEHCDNFIFEGFTA